MSILAAWGENLKRMLNLQYSASLEEVLFEIVYLELMLIVAFVES